MKALIYEGLVVDVQEVEFDIHPSMTWMDCPDDCVTSWLLEDGVFSAPPEPEDTMTYAEKRHYAYPTVGDQLDMLMKDMRDGTTTHQEACEAVKAAIPKP
jgi:hypothetical protein